MLGHIPRVSKSSKQVRNDKQASLDREKGNKVDNGHLMRGKVQHISEGLNF